MRARRHDEEAEHTVGGARVIPMHDDERLRRLGVRPLGGPAVVAPTDVHPVVGGRPAWEQRASAVLSFLRRRVEGDYDIDEFGFDRDLTENVFLRLLEPLYRGWFRVEVGGAANLPRTGGALLVANHAGGVWPVNMAMTAAAVHDQHPDGRCLRVLLDAPLFHRPALVATARKSGATVARAEEADRLLANGELVGTWPEGLDGLDKPFALRYRVQRFNHDAFVASALRAGVPIIPVAIVGAEEAYPVLRRSAFPTRMLGLPHLPVTPTFPWLGPLGLVPLPSKWHIEFGTPIDTDGLGADAAEDPVAAFELADRVRETVQETVYRLLGGRRSVWR